MTRIVAHQGSVCGCSSRHSNQKSHACLGQLGHCYFFWTGTEWISLAHSQTGSFECLYFHRSVTGWNVQHYSLCAVCVCVCRCVGVYKYTGTDLHLQYHYHTSTTKPWKIIIIQKLVVIINTSHLPIPKLTNAPNSYKPHHPEKKKTIPGWLPS